MTISIQKTVDHIFNDSWQYHDAGRSQTKWHGTSDCGVRALALACNMPYIKARKYLKAFTNIGKANNRRISTGIYRVDMNMAMESLGWYYTEMKFLRKRYWFDMPTDITLLCNMPRHFAVIKNGVLLDTFDSSNKYIIGYWTEL